MRRDARAFFRDRFFCDLNEDLLTFAEQIGDSGLMTLAPRLAAIAALFAWSTLFALLASAGIGAGIYLLATR